MGGLKEAWDINKKLFKSEHTFKHNLYAYDGVKFWVTIRIIWVSRQ